MQNPYAKTVMPLDLAKRMVEQRGGSWRDVGPFLEILCDGQMIGRAEIVDGGVFYLSICAAFAVHEAPKRLQ